MSIVACQNPARDPHQIADGARKVTLSAIVVWGEQDLRGDWTGDYTFCSFGCLSEWAATRAGDHDGRVLVDGPSDEVAKAEEAARTDQVVAPPAPLKVVPDPPSAA